MFFFFSHKKLGLQKKKHSKNVFFFFFFQNTHLKEITSYYSHLPSYKEQLGVMIVKGNEDSRRVVDGVSAQGLGEVSVIPHGNLPLAVLAKPDCGNPAHVTQIDGLTHFGPVMADGFLGNN